MKYILVFLILLPVLNFAQSLNFDGVNDYVDIGSVTPVGTKSSLTIECWVNIEDLTNVQGQNPIYGEYTTSSTGGLTANYFIIRDDGKVVFDQYTPSGGNFESTSSLQTNRWYHIAYVKDGTTQSERIYINGVLDASRQNQIETPTLREFAHIGARRGLGATPRYFDGSIDEFRIWSVARSQSDIQKNMKTELLDDPTGLELYLKFNEGSAGSTNTSISNTLIDETGTYSANLSGFAKTGSFSNWSDRAPRRSYVREAATGLGNGGNWENAYTDLSLALFFVKKDEEIWVAKGTYKPPGTIRNSSFQIPDSVKVYGGFEGNENVCFSLNDRDFSLNETILSGDIDTPNDSLDNSYHVVTTMNVTKETTLDGFTIEHGNANSNTAGLRDKTGGGLLNYADGSNAESTLTVHNCIFRNNYATNGGGGMGSLGNAGGVASALLRNNIFIANRSEFSGAGLYFGDLEAGVDIELVNLALVGNRVTGAGGYGGGVTLVNESGMLDITFLNCTITGNIARFAGGIRPVINSGTMNLSLINTVVSKNVAFQWGESDLRSSIEGTGTLVTTFQNSLVVGSNVTTNGNIAGTTEPLFLNPINPFDAPSLAVDFRLLPCSPLVNTGTSLGAPTDDVYMKTRTGTPDIGVFENNGPSNPTKIYIKANAQAGGSGTSWSGAFKTIQEAELLLNKCSLSDTIWVAQGTYYPTETNDRDVSFSFDDSVKVFGGFAGNELENYDLALRDFDQNASVLSGNINNPIDSLDNSFHVVRLANVGRETLIDGFTVSHGHATGAAFSDQLDGAGMLLDGDGNGNFSSPTIRNCTFTYNYARGGAGILCNGFQGESSPLIESCTFLYNKVSANGAGIQIGGNSGGISNTIIRNAHFAGNYSASRGAGIRNNCGGGDCNIEVTGSVFSGNVSDLGGTGISNTGDVELIVVNSTFTGNYSGVDAAGILSFNNAINDAIQISNSIFWKNESGTETGAQANVQNFNATDDIAFSMIEGASTSTNGNVPSVDPLFEEGLIPSMVPSIAGDFRLKICSPLADKGNNDSLDVSYVLDIANQPRIVNSTGSLLATVDLGAYEYQGNNFQAFLDLVDDTSSSQILGADVLEASNTVINPAEVLYHGNNHVLLKAGFETQSGTVFQALAGEFTCPE